MRSRGSVVVVAVFFASSLMLAPAQLADALADAPNCLELISRTATAEAPNGASYDLRFSEVAGATRYNLYGGTLSSLYNGVYDHASTGGICSITDGIGGDGQVLASIPAGTLPQNDYFLVTAQSPAGESVYGQNSSGSPIPSALAACP